MSPTKLFVKSKFKKYTTREVESYQTDLMKKYSQSADGKSEISDRRLEIAGLIIILGSMRHWADRCLNTRTSERSAVACGLPARMK
jgi:hypothetical protein